MRCSSTVKLLPVLALFAQAAPAVYRDPGDSLLPANIALPDLPFPSKVSTAANPLNDGINEARDFGEILSGAESIWDEATSAAASILHETTKIASLLDKATAAIGSVAAIVTSEAAKVVDDLTDRAVVVTESDKE
ncbi:hypothetical protein CNN01200 [Cryptococcus deneoformans JEC21]|uniref:Uncharacterized protein n=1 Tax=Cryptococcus deneoformans (strain JEC21 / ATCC MYA-565) TaxID=214684 RepID=Q5K740_CRYD1|nr:hypothetical protein CNN01200 [Cryptococcus neoformans var. neoformans JEC21]AAW47048.2 hypothetical protein CNN01200 [Cryptococcus neoformans var. neoformans JEC21]